jgi:type VI secretion system protein ImpG
MKQAFKQAYERELALLKERAALFQEDFPGLANRLGGLLEENLDPSIAGLLEGSAFLAARVQLNIDQQFRTFSTELLEQICPDALTPLPSAMMVKATPPGKPDDLVKGRTLNARDYVEATFKQDDRRITCRYRLAEPLEFWPISLPHAQYFDSATPLTAMGLDTTIETAAGLVMQLARTDGKPMGDLGATSLPIHFIGPFRDATAIYEQVFSELLRVTLRWEDDLGNPVFRSVPLSHVEQVGFDAEHPMFAPNERLFPGFSTLLEYFAFPRKFLGLKLTGLDTILKGIPTDGVQVIFEFDTSNAYLGAHFETPHLSLFCAPAVNLFEDDAKPITLDRRQHRLPVSPNRTPVTHFEVLRVTSVRAQYEGHRDKVEVLPLYAMPKGDKSTRETLYYTTESARRGLSQAERRLGGTRFRYEGTETAITIYEPPEGAQASHLFVSTLCSNRHLPEILPIADAKFHLLEDRTVQMTCVAGPSEPREAVAEIEAEGPHRMQAGDNYWRLISILSLSYRGLTNTDGSGNVDALREMMRLFSDVSDQLTEAQINALHSMTTRPVTRTVRRAEGYLPTRGVEIRLTFDESAFDQGGIIVLSGMLDRFLADYAAINTFTQTVVVNRKGKVLKTWPPRGGSGPLI